MEKHQEIFNELIAFLDHSRHCFDQTVEDTHKNSSFLYPLVFPIFDKSKPRAFLLEETFRFDLLCTWSDFLLRRSATPMRRIVSTRSSLDPSALSLLRRVLSRNRILFLGSTIAKNDGANHVYLIRSVALWNLDLLLKGFFVCMRDSNRISYDCFRLF